MQAHIFIYLFNKEPFDNETENTNYFNTNCKILLMKTEVSYFLLFRVEDKCFAVHFESGTEIICLSCSTTRGYAQALLGHVNSDYTNPNSGGGQTSFEHPIECRVPNINTHGLCIAFGSNHSFYVKRSV